MRFIRFQDTVTKIYVEELRKTTEIFITNFIEYLT